MRYDSGSLEASLMSSPRSGIYGAAGVQKNTTLSEFHESNAVLRNKQQLAQTTINGSSPRNMHASDSPSSRPSSPQIRNSKRYCDERDDGAQSLRKRNEEREAPRDNISDEPSTPKVTNIPTVENRRRVASNRLPPGLPVLAAIDSPSIDFLKKKEPQEKEKQLPRPEAKEKQESVLSPPVDEITQRLQEQMRNPNQQLKQLLSVISDENASLIRRVNACGALKTLALSKKNQVMLARTKGLVQGLTDVLRRVHSTDEERSRCINALLGLCMPKQNWLIVYYSPGVPEALSLTIEDDNPKVCHAACQCVSLLAKRNKEAVVENDQLMQSLAGVIGFEIVGKRGGQKKILKYKERGILIASRLSALKTLLDLSKNREVSGTLALNQSITSTLVSVAGTMEPAANVVCIAVLTNLSRLPDNATQLVYHVPNLVTTLVKAADSQDDESRKCALYALQNLACSSSCRQDLANTPNLLGVITKNGYKAGYPELQIAALNTLKNLSDDPFNLITITNTPGCTATLLALSNDNSNEMIQYLACDSLATLSHWLVTLSNGKQGISNTLRRPKIPTVELATFEQWQ